MDPSPFQRATLSPTLHLKPEEAENAEDVRNLPPSIFPCLDARPGASKEWQSTHIPFRDVVTLHAFCARNNLSAQSIMQAAWALLLQCYVGNPSVCFACPSVKVASNHGDSTAPETTAGVCKAEVRGDRPVIELIKGLRCRRYDAGLHLCTGHDAPNSFEQEALPANTALAFRYDQDRDWLETHQPVREAWAADDRVNVSRNHRGHAIDKPFDG